ncbi:hypothetical protein A2875_04830 [Candidatus Gottesmanbacteria bacterium RIFCSPHIGHO2_01_FULL_46_14]|uniref:Sortase n=2 Tax=Candidatus Gottesmaniibacteriota TaxID=1752720 RepID=A0A1F5ZN11_9BACT|nr:MAG: hypothetical protein A2875_04830 [Candidatus Gottesmanbacteria bacterium RIFCSPHIGHO2_01_FULL_46_14]OGG29475.1 MAG: hypothetical protein A2971_03835 [Candidatus Gottesmanbacteria bacterium RIFCSPLOWO2_01_FULL_46_21]
MNSRGVIYQRTSRPWLRSLGMGLIVLSLGGMVGPFIPNLKLEAGYAWKQLTTEKPAELPHAVPVVFNPLVTEDGSSIDPINTEFSLIVPKIGINAPVLAGVNPAKPGEYQAALQKGIAHASTSYFPDQDGTVYLFSHSTNYDWFVKDLNAVFYLLKNLSEGDLMVIFYKGQRYTYRLKEKRVVGPNEVSYLVPQTGKKRLILQTCWPPGSTAERLLIFADLIEEQYQQI